MTPTYATSRSTEMAESASAILLEQVRAQVAGQEDSLNSVRTRATTLVSVAGVVGGLFAPRFLTASHGIGYAAIAAFLGCGLLASVILFPRTVAFSIPFGQADLDWVQANGDRPEAGPAIALEAVKTLMTAYDHNKTSLARVGQIYAWQLALFGAQLLLWAIAAAVS
jgi:hypothetical protein